MGGMELQRQNKKKKKKKKIVPYLQSICFRVNCTGYFHDEKNFSLKIIAHTLLKTGWNRARQFHA